MTSTAVFLSAGHSNTDPGATTSAKDAKGKTIVRREADIAVEMRNMVAFYLQRAGVLAKLPQWRDHANGLMGLVAAEA